LSDASALRSFLPPSDRHLAAEFPQLRVETVECPEPKEGSNGKAEVLERLGNRASKPVWVTSDADVGVPDTYLNTVCSELCDPAVGLATCLYRAVPASSAWSRLEAARINTQFPAEVLLARALQGLRFGFGSTLAIRAETVARLGGFRSLRSFVGEDYVLGSRVAGRGLRVVLSSVPVATHLPSPGNLADVWNRQVRWSRTIRMQRPAGHAGLIVTHALAWVSLGMLTEAASLWPLALGAIAARLASATLAANRVGARTAPRQWAIVVAADLAACTVWLWSYFGTTVNWAGRRLRLGPRGRIVSTDRSDAVASVMERQ